MIYISLPLNVTPALLSRHTQATGICVDACRMYRGHSACRKSAKLRELGLISQTSGTCKEATGASSRQGTMRRRRKGGISACRCDADLHPPWRREDQIQVAARNEIEKVQKGQKEFTNGVRVSLMWECDVKVGCRGHQETAESESGLIGISR